MNVMIVGNFAADTGYAWSTINEYFATVREAAEATGGKAFVCFPHLGATPDKIGRFGNRVVSLDYSSINILSLWKFVRAHRIDTLYLTDQPVFSLKYFICRLCGVSRIIIHNHTSGDRTVPQIIKSATKMAINWYPLLSADLVIAVSVFVKERTVKSSCFPQKRIVRLWNGVDTGQFSPGNDLYVNLKLGIAPNLKIIFAYCRANKYKGIETLIESARILIQDNYRKDLFFLYCGDGPDLFYFRKRVHDTKLEEHFYCPGATRDINKILRGVAIVVVPSLWQEAFGLSVIEGMASGKTVIASNVGGIPEIIEDGVSGFLFPAGDEKALAERIRAVVDDPDRRKAIGIAAREVVLRNFDLKNQKKKLAELVLGSEQK